MQHKFKSEYVHAEAITNLMQKRKMNEHEDNKLTVFYKQKKPLERPNNFQKNRNHSISSVSVLE